MHHSSTHHFLVALRGLAEVIGTPHSATWPLAEKLSGLATTGMLSAGDQRVLGRCLTVTDHEIEVTQSFVRKLVSLLPLAHGAANTFGRGRPTTQVVS